MKKLVLLLFLFAFRSHAGEHILNYGIDPNPSWFGFESLSNDSSSSTTGLFEAEYEAGTSFGYEYRVTKPMDFGFAVGFRYHSENDLDSITENGTTTPASIETSSLQVNIIYLNAIHLWNFFYFTFGLSYADYDFTPAPGSGQTVELDDGFGLNFAIGWNLGDHFAIEYGAVATLFSLSTFDGTDRIEFNNHVWRTSTLRLLIRI